MSWRDPKSHRRSAAVPRRPYGGYHGKLGENALDLAVGEQLARARLDEERDQADVAELLGLTQGALSRLERGLTAWTLDRFVAACAVLHLRPQDVLLDALVRIRELRGADLAKATADLFPARRRKTRG